MPPTVSIKKLAALRSQVASLEAEIADAVQSDLAALPARFGFASAKDFIAAVRAATGAKRGPGRPAKAGKKRRRRAVITDEVRAGVKSMSEAGKTGSEIAAALRISLPTVAKLRKALGLVRKR
jgi:hypothetical protein